MSFVIAMTAISFLSNSPEYSQFTLKHTHEHIHSHIQKKYGFDAQNITPDHIEHQDRYLIKYGLNTDCELSLSEIISVLEDITNEATRHLNSSKLKKIRPHLPQYPLTIEYISAEMHPYSKGKLGDILSVFLEGTHKFFFLWNSLAEPSIFSFETASPYLQVVGSRRKLPQWANIMPEMLREVGRIKYLNDEYDYEYDSVFFQKNKNKLMIIANKKKEISEINPFEFDLFAHALSVFGQTFRRNKHIMRLFPDFDETKSITMKGCIYSEAENEIYYRKCGYLESGQLRYIQSSNKQGKFLSKDSGVIDLKEKRSESFL